MNFFRIVNNLFRFNRTNWKAVSLCFLAATVFWFFNALNKYYSSNVRLPLKFEFDESKFIPSKPLPADIYVNLGGNGWDLLRKQLGVKLPALIIPLERPAETKRIIGSALPPILAGQLGNLKINHVVTDTLYLSIEPKDSIKMKVVIDPTLISFKEGYGRTSPVVVLPDSILVEGPRSSLNHLGRSSIVITLPEKKLNSVYRQQLDVTIPEGESIKRKPGSLEVMFEVGEVHELIKRIKVTIVHAPYATHVMKDKDSVDIHVSIPVNQAAEFDEALTNVKAEVDLSDARSGGKKVLPTIKGLPGYAGLISTDSIRVKLY